MGSNGIVTEKAHLNVDNEKYSTEHERIFGKREKITCKHCDLSSRQKVNEPYECPHCGKENK